MLRDMTFERAKHGKTGKTRTLNGSRKNYNGLPEDNEEENFLATFSDALRETLPDACLFKGLDVDPPHQAKGKEPHASGADMIMEDCSQINVQQYFMKSMLSSFKLKMTLTSRSLPLPLHILVTVLKVNRPIVHGMD
ncbi:uncharacterized protein LOC134269464 [Saccostrea cucullata]|uniref:uncharacterized protein LOC134269464 n=1 Tax=Saccostrea cuccullata TaxID=36930 RepID=UPI002ED101E9